MLYKDKRTGEPVRIESHTDGHVPKDHPYHVIHDSGANYYITESRLNIQFELIKTTPKE